MTTDRYRTIQSLIDQASGALAVGQPQRAVWRLIDAAGMTADAVSKDEPLVDFMVGLDVPTGRGFKLERANCGVSVPADLEDLTFYADDTDAGEGALR